MKKILLLFTALFVISSCTLEPDDDHPYTVEFLPIEAVDYPAYVFPGHTYKIYTYFIKPNGCYLFDRFSEERDGDAIVIGLQTMMRVDGECKKYENEKKEVQSFTFKCNDTYQSGNSYHLKFYAGLDPEGNKQYIDIVIPVK